MHNSLRPFHLAFPAKNLKDTKDWYTRVLGCSIGRESNIWMDFNFFGHQIVAHLSHYSSIKESSNVDGESIPISHFGIILTSEQWEILKRKLVVEEVEFVVKPTTRFKNTTGEQSTMFVKDPSGNALEFKTFTNDSMIFKK